MSEVFNSEINTAHIREDILLMVGGHFTPAALSPLAYEEVLARAQSRAIEYLNVFETMFLGENFEIATQSRLLLPTFLKLLAKVEPEKVQAIAARLLRQYNAALDSNEAIAGRATFLQIPSEEATRLSQQSEDRRVELQALLQ